MIRRMVLKTLLAALVVAALGAAYQQWGPQGMPANAAEHGSGHHSDRD